MALIAAALEAAHQGLKAAGIDFVSGLPDGWQRNLHERIELDPDIRYVPVGNEGVGFSICAGAWLGGRKPALVMENSGLRVASEYIARISLGTGVPVTLVCSYRFVRYVERLENIWITGVPPQDIALMES